MFFFFLFKVYGVFLGMRSVNNLLFIINYKAVFPIAVFLLVKCPGLLEQTKRPVEESPSDLIILMSVGSEPTKI